MNIWKYYNGDLKYPNILNHSHEKEIAKAKPRWAYEYVSEHGIDEELEPSIAKDAYYSYHYELDILEGPFNLGEPAIAKDAYFSYQYTNKVLKKDFVLDGKLICKYEG